VTQKVHHQTERGARIALDKKQISQESYEAILQGELSLAEARELGRDRWPHDTGQASGGHEEGRKTPGRSSAERAQERPQDSTEVPPQPISRISKDDTTQECWCGCGSWASPGKHWRPGHDQRAKGIIKRAVTAGKADELSDRLRDYGQERGLI
jgi:hypothetical protein